jgi:hypothetical protein
MKPGYRSSLIEFLNVLPKPIAHRFLNLPIVTWLYDGCNGIAALVSREYGGKASPDYVVMIIQRLSPIV